MIPVVDARWLFAGPGAERARVDAQIADAAASLGFFSIEGPSAFVPTTQQNREAMLQVFRLTEADQRGLWRQFYEPSNPNVYRGWNPRDANHGVSIYDLGPDIAHPSGGVHVEETDPLLGATPLPHADSVPGWRDAVGAYYRSMERLGAMVMRSVARGLGIDELFFDSAFEGGISTLRLMRYEFDDSVVARRITGSEDANVNPELPRRGEHVDSGFVTLLCQHGVAGLSAKARSGEWVDVPPVDGHLVVNFGGVLERWTQGRIRATPHRVESEASLRYSIPFFFEPRVDAVISPLPTPWAEPFESFSYGDHLWAAMSKFPNFAGVADLRKPRGVPKREGWAASAG